MPLMSVARGGHDRRVSFRPYVMYVAPVIREIILS